MGNGSRKKQARALRAAGRAYAVGVAAWLLGGGGLYLLVRPPAELIVTEAAFRPVVLWLLGWTGLCAVATLTAARLVHDRIAGR